MHFLHQRLIPLNLLVATLLLPARPAAASDRFEQQFSRLTELLQGQRVGLLCCPTSVDCDYGPIADRLAADSGIRLVCFFSPEHGLRGDRQAGEKIDDYTDDETGLPVYSLYGPRRAPEPQQLEQVDLLVCDLQDVGARFYTKAWIMARAMDSAARAGKRFVVFDRPNPIGLTKMEGAPITFDGGLVGPLWPGQPFGVPTRHGMTVGEIMTLVNAEWAEPKARLTVVRIPGYRRTMRFEETGYPWVMPSPNLPTLETALVYPGTCLFEGTNLSEGRGTTRPFELIGAPFVDARRLADRLNAAGLRGVRFRAAWFTPTFEDHAGKRCAGVQLHITDRDTFEPVRTGLTMLKVVCDMHPEEVKVTEWASRLMGVPDLHTKIEMTSVEDLIQSWQDNLKRFAALRRRHLLYD